MKQFIVLFFIILAVGVFRESTVWANEMNYSVKAQLPDTQMNKQVSYFDLQLKPNAEEKLKVTVTNSSKEAVVLQLNANNALTNSNGVIDYTKHGVKPDKSMKYPLEWLIDQPQQKVSLNPRETKDVVFHLRMPKEAIKGLILGGIHVTKEEKKATSNKKNVTIENVYSYVIGVQIREDLKEVPANLVLHDIKPTLVNYRTAVGVKLQNPSPTLLKNVTIDAAVRQKNSDQGLHQVKKEQMKIAPNTHFVFPISWNNQEIQPGTYTLTMHVTSDQGKWDFSKDFTVKAKEVKQVNNEAVELEKQDHTLIYILLGIIALLIIGFLGYYLANHKKEETS